MKKDSDAPYQEAVARANVYRFLSVVYRDTPTLDLVQSVANPEFLEALAPILTERAVAELKQFTECIDADQDIVSLKQEYMALFAVPAGRYVTPFEDVYRGIRPDGKQERGPLLGERAVAVKILYRQSGAQMDQACKELPTHIGVELSFMSFLCEREAATIDNQDEDERSEDEQSKAVNNNIYRQYQQEFLHEHLNNWFPQLNQAIQEKAKSHFYRALAQLTEDFLAWDMTASVSPSIPEASTQDQSSSLGLRTG